MALGLLSLLQAGIVPGYLVLRLIGWKARGPIQHVTYMFATSLVVNYCLVYALTSLNLYTRAAVAVLLAIELVGLLWQWKQHAFEFRSRFDIGGELHSFFKDVGITSIPQAAICGLSLASFCSYALLWWRSFGTVFTTWDDACSWDRWAETWANNHFPIEVGYYPQLVPANWSLMYLISGSTEIRMFAKSLMLLFPIATMLLFLDLARKRKSSIYLVSLTLFAIVLYTFLGKLFVDSGYVETALIFFCFAALYAVLEVEEHPAIQNVLVAAAFAGGAGVVKQGGLYVTAVCTIWLGIVLYRRRTELAPAAGRGRFIGATMAGVLLLAPWYIRQYAAASSGNESPNISALAAFARSGRTLWDTAIGAAVKAYHYRGDFTRPVCWFLFLTVLVSLADRTARKVVLFLLGPILLLWALFFSYEVRTASLALPFGALASGVGIGIILLPIRSIWRRAGWLSQWKPLPACLGGAACLAALAYWMGRISTIQVNGAPGWAEEQSDLWTRPLVAAALALAVTGVLFCFRRAVVWINWYYTLGILAWLWFGTRPQSGSDLLKEQVERQKQIVAPVTDRLMYQMLDTEGLRGRIATEYWVLGRLPVLRNYYKPHWFPESTSVQWLKGVAATPGVCYILLADRDLSPEARDALAQGLYRTRFLEESYRMIQTCNTPAPASASPSP